ncbi:uncharacterized protein DSM5745_00988 [Aspergillus mulundensis]|uniref:Uncharacterized protein n=1 Tax=Aspergillus mulundensis TaxID=1810919 RepID=A0A3D8T532_9EURO|nr:hypothetical protein DSM5745_00988 [Aspergillus mulundensis]RDW93666.1 hypothetical protein DSM5745_00988 [Aspergillus mulundensis]
MKLSILTAATLALPALAQLRPPIQFPGLGECPDECISIRIPTSGALMACCGTAEGCVDCGPDCTASCASGRYGACVSLGDTETTCSTGCEEMCQSELVYTQDYTLCNVGGHPLEPTPEGCP